MPKQASTPLANPNMVGLPQADVIAAGLPIPPIDRIKLFSPTQWEDFVLEWTDSQRSEYSTVEKCAGAGDKGRDIIGIISGNDSTWDNFQCKHYDHRLAPTDVWLELAKLVYYTFHGDYSYPRRYYFAAPQGVGTTLSNLLRKPALLKSELIQNWEKY
ncbi:MAG TPA: hypothetical protein VGM92_10375, partial [Candidatus Kapabacteria bacterium]